MNGNVSKIKDLAKTFLYLERLMFLAYILFGILLLSYPLLIEVKVGKLASLNLIALFF